jgi:hypothetical protein
MAFDEIGFRSYMKKQKKTSNTIESCVENANKLERFLAQRGTNQMNAP